MAKEYWQCCHTRKCKWVGEYEQLGIVKNTDYPDIEAYDTVCPNCGGKDFYTLNQEEFNKIKNKSKTV